MDSFYREQTKKLFAYLVRVTGDYHLSNDIMQESFAKLIQHYDGSERKPALLFTIARNALTDLRRRRKTETEYLHRDEEERINPERDLMIREEYRQVMECLGKMDQEERDILSLIVSSGLSYREISTMMDTSEANVKVRVHRARVRLKNLLKADSR